MKEIVEVIARAISPEHFEPDAAAKEFYRGQTKYARERAADDARNALSALDAAGYAVVRGPIHEHALKMIGADMAVIAMNKMRAGDSNGAQMVYDAIVALGEIYPALTEMLNPPASKESPNE